MYLRLITVKCVPNINVNTIQVIAVYNLSLNQYSKVMAIPKNNSVNQR